MRGSIMTIHAFIGTPVLNRQEFEMTFVLKCWRPVLIFTLILITAVPALAQVPRAVFTEMGSATW